MTSCQGQKYALGFLDTACTMTTDIIAKKAWLFHSHGLTDLQRREWDADRQH